MFRAFTHKIREMEVTFLGVFETLEEVARMETDDDTFLCCLTLDDAGESLPQIMPIVVRGPAVTKDDVLFWWNKVEK